MSLISIELSRYGLNRRIIDILEDNKYRFLRDIQSRALKKGLLDGENLLITAPSGSGKTLIGEIAAIQNVLENNKKSLFLVPYKALAYEKYEDFNVKYSELGISVAMKTGDYNTKGDITNADIIVATYERFDAILRRNLNAEFQDRSGAKFLDRLNDKLQEGFSNIGTIVVDEIHILNDHERGPRLEGLLTRLRGFLPTVQLICLSATIANPEELAKWLGCKLIKSNVRPVELYHQIIPTTDKIKSICDLVKMTLESSGQVLIFTKTRKEAQQLAQSLVGFINSNQLLDAKASVELKDRLKMIDQSRIAKLDKYLLNVMRYQVAYHHAGLSFDIRRFVEKCFKDHLIKVIACTTTLAAGVNLPAKMVIIKDVQIITTDPNRLTCDDSFYWRDQLEPNLLHQILGRAGRPGFDNIGIGVILAPTNVDGNRIEQYYFRPGIDQVKAKYGKVESKLNQREVLYEQLLVLLLNGPKTQAQLLEEFESTYWYYQTKNEDPTKEIDQIIEIGALSIKKTVQDLSTQSIRDNAKKISDNDIKITKVDNKVLQAIITDKIPHTCAFYQDFPQCTCREFKHNRDTRQITLCRHLIKLIEVGMKKYPRLTNDLACLSLQREFILDSLIQMKMVEAVGEKYYITKLGSLTASLVIKPSTIKVIEAKLSQIYTPSDVIEVIEALHPVELNKYADPAFLQIMTELVQRPQHLHLDNKILEITYSYNKGRGDVEEYIRFASRMANAVSEVAMLHNFPEIKKQAEIIKDRLLYEFWY
ncbi:MAG: DEAD/DEAH box helicase [Candidatus Helarchaeota archaeon]